MTFDELVAIVQSLVGRIIDIHVSIPAFDDDAEYDVATRSLVGFSGTIEHVSRTGPGKDRWTIWLQENPGPSPGTITLNPDIYLNATFTADREEADYSDPDTHPEHDPDDKTGESWSLVVYQASVRYSITVYLV